MTEHDEDKTQILNGSQRLRYFAESYHSEAVHSPLKSGNKGLLKKIRNLFIK